MRWQHPRRGLVSPLEFVPVAERTGLIGPLTSWVLGEALRQCGRWRAAGFAVPVAVNISMRNLREPLFLDTVDWLLRSSGAPATTLELEITESTIMSEPAHTNETLRRLHDRGIRLSIDDFGTGYSSLAYLDRLPVQEVKIDRSFVHDVTSNAGHASVVTAVLLMCRIFGLPSSPRGSRIKPPPIAFWSWAARSCRAACSVVPSRQRRSQPRSRQAAGSWRLRR